MLALNEKHYQIMASKLTETIGESYFFNGIITLDTDDCQLSIKATLLIYREMINDPCDATARNTRIDKIVPVWCECISLTQEGIVENDFTWRRLAGYLRQCC